MALLFKHFSVKKHGYEVYKDSFLIDLDTYNRKKNAIDLCMHDVKEKGDLTVGTFSLGNDAIIYMSKYVNSEEKKKVENIVKAYFTKK